VQRQKAARREIAGSNNCGKLFEFFWQGSTPSDTSGQAAILGGVDSTPKEVLKLLRTHCEEPCAGLQDSSQRHFKG